jgi:hypothetical protein
MTAKFYKNPSSSLFFFFALGLLLCHHAQGQLVESLIVETYYIADTQDAEVGASEGLEEGMTTYRVYLDLAEGAKLIRLFGDANHKLRIQSTENFFNSSLGNSIGHRLNGLLINPFPLTLIDSYIAFSSSTSQNFSILKALDSDGSLFPDGVGSSQILTNSDAAMGIPLTEADGLLPLPEGVTTTQPQPFNILPPNLNDSLSAVFGNSTSSNSFISGTISLTATEGVPGLGEDNLFLIGQFTTAGELSFTLNIIVEDAEGNQFTLVGDGVNLQEGEIVNPFLTFPPQCGCTDPNYIEFDPAAPCDDGSCENLVVFGCDDPEACNYNPDANFPVPQLCCYGLDDCGELDPLLVCPELSTLDGQNSELLLYPNPASSRIFVQLPEQTESVEWIVFNGTGVKITEGLNCCGSQLEIGVSDLPTGIYILTLRAGNKMITERFGVVN